MNKPARKIVIVLWMFVSLVIAGGCSSHRKAVTSESNYGWTRLSLPIKIKIDEPQRFSIGGTATFERDSSVVFSFRMLGMEVAAMQIRSDSVLVVDKYHKQYISAPTEEIVSELNLDMADIQDLLLGRVPTHNSRRVKNHSITIKESEGMIENISITPENQKPVTIDFSQAVMTDRGKIAEEMSYTGRIGNHPLSISIVWSPEKSKWDADVNVKELSVGRGYKRIPAENLKRMLQQN